MNKTVLYEGWQMGCCGTPFKVGDSVEWTVNDTSDINNDILQDIDIIDYLEEHHDEAGSVKAKWVLSGKVESITLLYNRYKTENNRLIPVEAKLIETNDTEHRKEEIDEFRFCDFIVKLSDAKTRSVSEQKHEIRS